VNALRPFPGYANVFLRDNSDNSNYHSLQLSASRRLTRGLSFGVNLYLLESDRQFRRPRRPQDQLQPQGRHRTREYSREQVLNFQLYLHVPVLRESSNAVAANRARRMGGGWRNQLSELGLLQRYRAGGRGKNRDGPRRAHSVSESGQSPRATGHPSDGSNGIGFS
jgi:hypothetical protein